MKWIHLHYENQARIVNVEHITVIEATRDNDEIDGSFLRTTGGCFYADETPDEIMRMIVEAA